jgi:hypothetical protein
MGVAEGDGAAGAGADAGEESTLAAGEAFGLKTLKLLTGSPLFLPDPNSSTSELEAF